MDLMCQKEGKFFSVLNTAKVPFQKIVPVYTPAKVYGDNLFSHTLTNTDVINLSKNGLLFLTHTYLIINQLAHFNLHM